MNKTMKVAIVGLGNRGQALLRDAVLPAGEEYGVEVVSVYDSYADRTELGIEIVREKTGKTPIGAKNYQEIIDNPEIDGIILTSAWEMHIPQAIAAMNAGKRVAMEVGGAYTLEDCWNLVNTYEQTGIPCMMLENCCYGKWELMVMNMVRQGLFGDIVHCSGGYHHDLRDEITGGAENRHYRLRNYLNRNCENYPTHELGPIAKLLDVNDGNRMVSLSSTASCAKGLHQYVLDNKGADSPLANAEFAQGDIITTVIKCAKGQTIVLTLDTTLPRSYSRSFTVRGTKGAYFEDNNMVFLDGVHNKYDFDSTPIWNNANQYFEDYKHPLWADYDPKGGHGGMDYLVISAFFDSLTTRTNPPIDVYDCASYMSISALSEESIHKGGAVVAIPDFTRGQWYWRKDLNDSKFKLTR